MPKPKPKTSAPCPAPVSRKLRDVVAELGLSANAAAVEAGLNPTVVRRFLNGQRDLKLASADKLAHSLGLKLVETARKGRRPGASRPPAAAADSD